MAKRFTDSRKWDDGWFTDLDPSHKLMWIYILDKCDHSGIYKINKKLEECCLGVTLKLTDEVFKNRVMFIGEDKFFIPKFIEFQYGVLNESNRVHNSVINTLKKEGAYTPLISPLQGAKDKDKNKDKDKDKDIIKYLDNVYMTDREYKKLVNKLGEDKTNEYIERLNNYIGSKGKKYKSHYSTILVWSDKDRVDFKVKPTQAQINTMASLEKFRKENDE